MSVFTLSIATVKTAYDGYITAQGTLASAQAALDSLGARPVQADEITSDATYNFVVGEQQTWDTNYATQNASVISAQTALRTAELAVIDALGYGTGDIYGICLDQWVKVVGSGGGTLTYTSWIGAATESTYLTVIQVEPTQAFPNY